MFKYPIFHIEKNEANKLKIAPQIPTKKYFFAIFINIFSQNGELLQKSNGNENPQFYSLNYLV